jgi:hypothetical protein
VSSILPGWPEPQFGPTVMPEPVQPPTWAAIAELAERAQAGHLVEQQRLEQVITARIEAAGLTVVRTDPVEEAAAHPAAIHRLRTEVFRHALPTNVGGQIGQITGLPCVPDESLPPGEIHLRPHPRPAGGLS